MHFLLKNHCKERKYLINFVDIYLLRKSLFQFCKVICNER